MKSYASVDRVEEEFVVCEVELLPIEKSNSKDFSAKDTIMCSIWKDEFLRCIDDVKEGDILIVEHDGKYVSYVYSKDEEEKQRRIEILQKLVI